MAEILTVVGDESSDVPVITINYGPEGMLQSSGSELSDQLIKQYKQLSDKTKSSSVVVDIKAQTAGSPLIRALVSLHQDVSAHKGQLICVGYPTQFLPSLNALGVTSLPGFKMKLTREEAVASLGGHSAKAR
jgi:hypothetical protein